MKAKREYIRIMRSKVMIVAQKEMHWSKEFLNDMMESWGFGRSLRKLSAGELNDIIRLMRGDIDPAQLNYGIGALDSQGKYMYSLMKDAGWDMPRLRGWWLKKMSASHWKGLQDSEKRATIAMLKKYANKEVESGELKVESLTTENTENTEDLKTQKHQNLKSRR